MTLGDDYRWHYDYCRLARDSGFNFQTCRPKSTIDKTIGCLDIEQVIRDSDIAVIEKHIATVVEFTLDNDQTSVLDPTFVKVFCISQLLIQYLLFCKKYLDNTVALIKKEFQKNNEETKNLKRYIDELKQEAANSRKQIKELKSALNCQIVSTQNMPIFQCNECPKAFSTEEYLLAHIKRRHDSFTNIGVSGTSFQAETDKLQLEIKALKERLNNTEKYIQHDDQQETSKEKLKKSDHSVKPHENNLLSDLQHKFEILKVHVDNELRILQTQKFDEQKYEKWFETFLNKLELLYNRPGQSKNNRSGDEEALLCKHCHTRSDENQNNIERIDSTTQTDFTSPLNQVCRSCKDKHFHPDITEVTPTNNQRRASFMISEDTERLKDTENTLHKFEEILQEKMTGSFEKIENQVQSFCNKISEMEKEKLQKTETTNNDDVKINKSDTSSENLHVSPKTVVPKPRKKIIQIKEAFTSSPIQKPNTHNHRNKMNVKSAETITKTTISILPKNISVQSMPLPKKGTENKSKNKESDSDSSLESSTDSSDSEEDEDIKYVAKTKPSTSTLGNRSISSLKEAAFLPEVMEGLQNELEAMLNNRLEQLGVSPEWKTLPTRSYERVMSIVSHQANLVKKNISNYMHIRNRILKDVNRKITEKKRKNNNSEKLSKFKNILHNPYNNSKPILDSKSHKKTTVQQTTPSKGKIKKTADVIQSALQTKGIYTTDSDSDIVIKTIKPDQMQQILALKPIKSNSKMYKTDSDSEIKSNAVMQLQAESRNHNSTKKIEDNQVETLREDTNKNLRIIKAHALSQSNLTDQTQKAFLDVIEELNNTVTTINATEECVVENITNNIDDKPTEVEELQVKPEGPTKGVLKNYPSTGSLQKKKVLFDLKFSDSSSQKLQDQTTVPVKANEDNSTTSVASSVLDGSRHDEAPPINNKKKQDVLQSDLSDWDISEILG